MSGSLPLQQVVTRGSMFQWANLPPACIDNVISKWLNVKDIGTLDTAVSSTRCRQLLFRLYEELECAAFANFTITSVQNLRWIMIRSIDINKFYIDFREAPRGMPSFQWLCSVPYYLEIEYVGSRQVHDADVNQTCEFTAIPGCNLSPIIFACRMGWEDIVRLLCRLEKVIVTAEVLVETVRARHVNILRYLCTEDGRFDINTSTNDDEPPLITATAMGDESLVKVVLDLGADVNGRFAGRRTPLHAAVENNFQSLVRILLAHGADANFRTDDGRTPLYVALQLGFLDIARVLIVHGGATLDNAIVDINPSFVKMCQLELLDLGGVDPISVNSLKAVGNKNVVKVAARSASKVIRDEATAKATVASYGAVTERRVRKPSAKLLTSELLEVSSGRLIGSAFKSVGNSRSDALTGNSSYAPQIIFEQQQQMHFQQEQSQGIQRQTYLQQQQQYQQLQQLPEGAEGGEGGEEERDMYGSLITHSIGDRFESQGQKPGRRLLNPQYGNGNFGVPEPYAAAPPQQQPFRLLPSAEAAAMRLDQPLHIDPYSPAEGIHGLVGFWPDRFLVPKHFVHAHENFALHELPELFRNFLQLPQTALEYIVGKYLDVDEAARLDSACTNHAYRPQLLQVFRGLKSSVFDNFKYYCLDACRWVIVKGVALHDFRLYLSAYKSMAKHGMRMLQHLMVLGETLIPAYFLNHHKDRALLDINDSFLYFMDGAWVRVTPLMYAAKMGHAGVCQMLIQSGALVDHHEQFNSSALIIAAFAGNTTCLTTLIYDGKADVNQVDFNYDTALHNACRASHVECVLTLLEAGINPDLQNARGNTALHMVCEIKNIPIVKALIQYGANPNIRSKSGRTALHWACEKKFLDIAEFLIVKCGADAHARDHDGVQPVDLAPIYSFIVQAGGRVDFNSVTIEPLFKSDQTSSDPHAPQTSVGNAFSHIERAVFKNQAAFDVSSQSEQMFQIAQTYAVAGGPWFRFNKPIGIDDVEDSVREESQGELLPVKRRLNWTLIAESFRQRFINKTAKCGSKVFVKFDFTPEMKDLFQCTISWWTMLLMDAIACRASHVYPMCRGDEGRDFNQHIEFGLAVSYSVSVEAELSGKGHYDTNLVRYSLSYMNHPWNHFDSFVADFMAPTADREKRNRVLALLKGTGLRLQNIGKVLTDAVNDASKLAPPTTLPVFVPTVASFSSASLSAHIKPPGLDLQSIAFAADSIAHLTPIEVAHGESDHDLFQNERQMMLDYMEQEHEERVSSDLKRCQDEVVKAELDQHIAETFKLIESKDKSDSGRSQITHPLFVEVLAASQGIPKEPQELLRKGAVVTPVREHIEFKVGLRGEPLLGMQSGLSAPIGSQGLGSPVPCTLGVPVSVGLTHLVPEDDLFESVKNKKQRQQQEWDLLAPLTADLGLAVPYMAPMPIAPTVQNTAAWHPSQGYTSNPILPLWNVPARLPGERACIWIHLPPQLRQRIIANYLSVSDLCALDLAVGSIARRKELCAVCVGMRSPAIDSFPYTSTESLIWVMLRSIDIRNFTFTMPKLPRGMTAFHHVCAESMEDAALLIIIRGKNVDVNALAQYSARDKCSKAEKAVDKVKEKKSNDAGKSSANAKKDDRMLLTPLQNAFFTKNIKMIRLLVLVARANLDILDPFGNTLLHYAAEAGNIELVRLFVQAGANTMIKGSKGNTALHWAARMGHVEIVRTLVAEGKSLLDVQNEAGYTPLHLAVKEVHFAVTHMLVAEYSASVNLQDKKGRIPLQIATSRNLPADLVQLLEEATVRVTRAANMRKIGGA